MCFNHKVAIKIFNAHTNFHEMAKIGIEKIYCKFVII